MSKPKNYVFLRTIIYVLNNLYTNDLQKIL